MHKPIPIEDGVRHTCFFRFRPDDFPAVTTWYQLHLAPRSPPAIHFSRQNCPDLFVSNNLSQVIEQRLINVAFPPLRKVIRVGNKTHHSVSSPDESQLFLPKVQRIVIQNMKERIILSGSERKLEDFANEIRHNRATATAQWFQMGDVWNRHVVRKVQRIIPVFISLHSPAPKAP